MNIVILSVYPFPNGFAATNRLISYSKGLIELGNNVTNIIVRPTEKYGSANSSIRGNYQGINYLYSNTTPYWSKYFPLKLLQLIKGFINSLVVLSNLNRNKKIDIIIVNIDIFIYDLVYSLFSKFILKRRVVFISDEYPYALRKNRFPYKYIPMLFKVVEKFAYRTFDGIIVMTKSLQEYFKRITENNIPIELVLMTVEVERFEITNIKRNNEKYLAYIGDLTLEKDGLDIMIKSFGIVNKYYPEYRLKIAGSTKNVEDVQVLKKLVKELDLEEYVDFIGKLNRDSVPEFLNNAEILLLSRPYSDRAQGGFPTKLGEYLATGLPIVVTAVGEIPDYLSDGVNAYLAVPGSIESFSNKLLFALNNPEHSKQIGLAGKEVAKQVFNYKVQSKIMADFLTNLL